MHTAISHWAALGALAVLGWGALTVPTSGVEGVPATREAVDSAWPRVAIVMPAHMSPEQIVGVSAQELLRIDAADPGRAQAIDAAVRDLGVSIVLVTAENAGQGGAEVEWLMERSPSLRHGLAMGEVTLQQVRLEASTGRLQWQGGEPVNWALIGLHPAAEDDSLAAMLAAASTGPSKILTAAETDEAVVDPVPPTPAAVSGAAAGPVESGLPWGPVLGVLVAAGIIWYSRGAKLSGALQFNRLLPGTASTFHAAPLNGEAPISEVERQNPRLHDALARLRRGLQSSELL